MAAPVNESWSKTNASDADLDKVTLGQDTSFPATWPTERLFWRTDENKIYKNTGTEIAPVFEIIQIEIPNMPAGVVMSYAGPIATLPDGWLLCDGSEVSRLTFIKLLLAIGLTYGIGDGSTTFNLPDLETNNRFLRYAENDGEIGDTGGQDNTNHTHTVPETLVNWKLTIIGAPNSAGNGLPLQDDTKFSGEQDGNSGNSDPVGTRQNTILDVSSGVQNQAESTYENTTLPGVTGNTITNTEPPFMKMYTIISTGLSNFV